jgi:hypothetical protein
LGALDVLLASVAILLLSLAIRRTSHAISVIGIVVAVVGLVGSVMSIGVEFAGSSVYLGARRRRGRAAGQLPEQPVDAHDRPDRRVRRPDVAALPGQRLGGVSLAALRFLEGK